MWRRASTPARETRVAADPASPTAACCGPCAADDFSRAPVRLGVLGVNYLPGKVPAAGRTHATKCWAGYTPRVAGAVLLARDVAVAGAGDPCPLGSDVIVHGGRSAVSLLEFNQFAASAFAGRCPFHAGR